ncbi:hypothetical protein JHK86_050397 [Glycine max]|nr:hypothetical protein JHK86_050397 [Glycine max]
MGVSESFIPVDGGGNAARAGLKAGDQVLYTSSFYGDELWPMTSTIKCQNFAIDGAFIMPCGNCSYSSKGHDDLCEAFFTYNRGKGTLYEEFAILGCAIFTAYGAMAHAPQVCPGDFVAVIGSGGVGSSCLQIAKAFGASDIIVMDVRDEKLQKAKTFGATHTVNSAKEDPIEKILLCAFLYMYLS